MRNTWTETKHHLLIMVLTILAAAPLSRAQQDPPVCGNAELLSAIRIIDAACRDISCNFARLRELDNRVQKRTLLAALRDPYLQPVHIFFPLNETDVHRSFDWATTKREQLATLQYIDDPDESIVYVIGRASTIGNRDVNVRLSAERMRSVMRYLKDELHIKCRNFHGGYLGKEVLQLDESDARLLNLNPGDYRSDTFILNQSVEIFVFPCKRIM